MSKLEKIDEAKLNRLASVRPSTADGYLDEIGIVRQWERQINTPYAKLSDKEKASDMEQVGRYWPLILQFAKDYALGIVGEDDRMDGSSEYNPPGVKAYYTSPKDKIRNQLRAEQRNQIEETK